MANDDGEKGTFKVKIKDSGAYLSPQNDFNPCRWTSTSQYWPIAFQGAFDEPNQWTFNGPGGRAGYRLLPDESQNPMKVAGNSNAALPSKYSWSLEAVTGGGYRLKLVKTENGTTTYYLARGGGDDATLTETVADAAILSSE